ncbi:haloacid dehalogenase-like hydrolase [Sporomusa sp.]|uniref:haloacid dehalogenase-like hydrolase n=1 Tax=Sporomusa sp. TaxID=2078658 RepID=UPI002B64919C|nr:haloacid dehalogenase-like hydrolase [Sporomusa sp.]HWR44932.1 haloacid dehalogenase-like hydrolase [Sporomusa sp.]
MYKKNWLFKLALCMVLSIALILPAFLTDSAFAAPQSNAVIAATNPQVLDQGRWAPGTYTAIQKLIEKNGKNSPNYNPSKKPYAVFDWDNTCGYSDTEENLLIYQLDNLKYKMTPAQFRYAFTYGDNAPIPEKNFKEDTFKNEAGQPINITKIADDVCADYEFFWNNYRGLNPDAANNMTLAEIKATDQFKDFKAKFWFTYYALDETFDFDISWTWLLNFFQGYTPEELKGLVAESTDYALGQKIDNAYFDSPVTLPGTAGVVKNSGQLGNYFRQGLRITPEMSNLMNTLRANGIDVYVSTASLDDVIRGYASNPKYGYNVPAENVLGMRLVLDEAGRYKPEIPDKTLYAINAKHGKSVNINKYLVSKHQSNPILICGDSDGDYDMMVEFSGFNGAKKINDLSPMQMVLIINRVKGGNIGALSKNAASQMGTANPTIVLQGRDENTGMWIPDEKTLRLGKTSLQLVK